MNGADPVTHPAAESPLLARLRAGQPVTALGVRASRTPDIARMAAATGHDAIWVDLEHSPMPVDCAAQICMTAHDLGLAALVRVPEREYGMIGRLLDGGASGIIAPRVETPQQAADLVGACLFPPQGHRSAIAGLPHLGWRRMPAGELNAVMNRRTVVKVLIESPLGIRNIEDIARVPGVDIVGIGTNDLCAELGVPGDFRHALVREAHDHALAACARAGTLLMIGGIADAAYTAQLIGRGAAPFLMTGIDADILLAGLQQRAAAALASVQVTG